MLTRLNTFLVVLNLGIVGLGCSEDYDLYTPTGDAKTAPPMIGSPLPDAGVPAAVKKHYDDFLIGKPGPVGPAIGSVPASAVELVQSKLDVSPQMGPCPIWGSAEGPGWMQAFRFGSPYANQYPDGQPNNCRELPPNSYYPNVSWFYYPSGVDMNDRIRSFFVWVRPLQCVRVSFWQHDPAGGNGRSLVYQACGTTTDNGYAWSGNVEQDGGGVFGVTQVKIEWWSY